MSEITVNKKGTILDEEENFKPIHDNFRFYDHFSKFSGLAVAQLYLICAAVTGYEVISRYIFDSPTQWVFDGCVLSAATIQSPVDVLNVFIRCSVLTAFDALCKRRFPL